MKGDAPADCEVFFGLVPQEPSKAGGSAKAPDRPWFDAGGGAIFVPDSVLRLGFLSENEEEKEQNNARLEVVTVGLLWLLRSGMPCGVY